MLKKVSYLIVLLTVSAVVSSCASGAKKGETVFLTDYGKYTDNYLVYKQTRLALPDGWSFLPRKDKDSKIIVFKIDDNQNNVVGDFAYWATEAESELSPEKVADFYVDVIKDEVENITVYPTRIDGKVAHIISCSVKKRGYDRFIALIVEGKNLNIITLTSDQGYLFSHKDVPFKIFNSYSFQKKGLNERINKNGISFSSSDGAIEWYSDIEGGLILFGEFENRVFAFAMEKTTIKETSEIPSRYKFTKNIEEFPCQFTIGSKVMKGKAVGYKDNDELTLYHLVTYKGQNYIILSVISNDHPLASTDFYKHKFIVKMFSSFSM